MASRASTRWLNDDEMYAWRNYVETVGDLTRALTADMEATGLTPGDYQVLVYLSEQESARMRMCDLADILQLSPGGLTRRLDGLVTEGLVSRQGSPDDGRVMLAVLTDRGRRALEAAAPVHVESVRRRIIDRLTPAQIRCLGSAFAAIRSGLEDDNR